MSVISGLNHVAVITADLGRFVDFYTRIFDMKEVFREELPGLRHAILQIPGSSSWIHPAEIPGNPHATAERQMFERGHLDHLALTAQSRESFDQIRERLVAANASDGVVEDLGAFHTLWFQDPDGMRCELTLVVDPSLRGIHGPRPLQAGTSGQP